MIDWLLLQSPGLSLMLLLLCASYSLAIRYLGAGYYYALWLFVPLQLLAAQSLSLSNVVADLAVSRYVVVGQESFSTLQISSTAYQAELFSVWLSGALLLLFVGAWQHRHFMAKLQLQPMKLRELAIPTPQRMRVFSSENLHSPMITGLLFPKLILPADFSSQPEKMQTLMLRHELVHLSRGDIWWNALAVSLLVIFWFNPLCWVAYRYFRQSQELACDARVLQDQDVDTRLMYAKSFVNFAVQQQRSTFTSLYYGGKHNMKDRIQNMRSDKKSFIKVLPLAALLAVAVPISQAIGGQGVQKTAHEFKVHPVMRIEPVYPKAAAEQGIEGSVVLKFSVRPDGAVANVEVIRSNPELVFDESASDALQQWQYQKVETQVDNLLVQLDYVLAPKTKDNLLANLEQINVSPHKD